MAIPPTPTTTDNFWSGANSGAGVVLPTTGDAQQSPQDHMPGSAAGARPDGYVTAAQAVYIPRTGIGAGRLPEAERPASFSSATPADFATWHSAYQVEWLKGRSFYDVGDASGNRIAFYILTEDNRPVNLMTMTKAEYGQLSERDKVLTEPDILVGTRANIGWYLGLIGRLDQLGLTFDQSTVSSALSGLQSAINDSGLPTADKAVFLGQFQLLRGGDPRSTTTTVADADMMANITGAVANDAYAERIAAISERLDRAIRFHQAPDPVNVHIEARVVVQHPFGNHYTALKDTVGLSSLTVNSNSTDGAASIRGGYAEFMRAERAILANQTMRAAQANSPFADPKLDVANLINFFQLRYEDEARAVADSGTEEIRQLNKLLQDYALMQQLVQKQIGFYDPAKADEKRRFMNLGSYTNGDTVDGQFIEMEWDLVQDVRGLEYTVWDTEANTRIDGIYGGTSKPDLRDIAADRNVPRFHWSLIMEGSSSMKTLAEDAAAVGRNNRTPAWTGNELDATQAAALSMFMSDGLLSGGSIGNTRTHPLEALYGANRPQISIIDGRGKVSEDSLKLMSKNEWDSFATQLNETVTILNQQNQIRQNEIQNAEKQANRHFELGNNALRKMNDILMSIGRI